jgi:hypothetical protein
MEAKSDSMPPQSSSKTDDPENETFDFDRLMKLQADQIRRDLTYASILPAIVLISISGNPGLFTLCFGGIATYILDLLESVEVSSPDEILFSF